MQRFKRWDDGPGMAGSLWTDGEHVWRLNTEDATVLNTTGGPMGLRWECSVEHYMRYNASTDPNHVDNRPNEAP